MKPVLTFSFFYICKILHVKHCVSAGQGAQTTSKPIFCNCLQGQLLKVAVTASRLSEQVVGVGSTNFVAWVGLLPILVG